jgi:hypothetical protein
MCSYLTGAGAQAAPSRPRPPPLRKLEKMGARIEKVCPALRGKHAAGGSRRRMETRRTFPDFSRVSFRVQRHGWFRGKTAFRVGGLKWWETWRTYQSRKGNRASWACFIGTLAAVPGSVTLRAIRMPASNSALARARENFRCPTLRIIWTLSPGGNLNGPCAIRARGGNGACRWRDTAPRSPRARGFGNGKFFERAGCGETRRCAPRKKQSRWRG